MTTTSHFRTDPAAIAHFDRIAKTSISNAVAAVISMGFSVLPEDVPTPTLTQLGRTEPCLRSAFSLDHGYALSMERIALQLVQGQESTRRASAAAEAKRDADERAAWTRNRAVELEADHFAKLKASWQAQAEAEAVQRFAPVAAPAAVSEPEPARKPRKAA